MLFLTYLSARLYIRYAHVILGLTERGIHIIIYDARVTALEEFSNWWIFSLDFCRLWRCISATAYFTPIYANETSVSGRLGQYTTFFSNISR